MDNYTLINDAARRRQESERGGFSALSRLDQADRWAAWQASADATRPSDDFSDYIPAQQPEPAIAEPAVAEPPAPQPASPQPPVPQPRRSFELYNGIMARHRRIFGPQS